MDLDEVGYAPTLRSIDEILFADFVLVEVDRRSLDHVDGARHVLCLIDERPQVRFTQKNWPGCHLFSPAAISARMT